MLLGACVWSLCQLLWNTTLDAGLAALYMRGSLLGSLRDFPGPLPPSGQRHRRETQGLPASCCRWPIWRRSAAGWPPLPRTGSWRARNGRAGAGRYWWGPHFRPSSPSAASCPLAAGGYWLLRRRAAPLWRVSGVELAGLICFAVVSLTDVLLPLLEIPFPRLGSASFVAWAGVAWWLIYRHRESSPRPAEVRPRDPGNAAGRRGPGASKRQHPRDQRAAWESWRNARPSR